MKRLLLGLIFFSVNTIVYSMNYMSERFHLDYADSLAKAGGELPEVLPDYIDPAILLSKLKKNNVKESLKKIYIAWLNRSENKQQLMYISGPKDRIYRQMGIPVQSDKDQWLILSSRDQEKVKGYMRRLEMLERLRQEEYARERALLEQIQRLIAEQAVTLPDDCLYHH